MFLGVEFLQHSEDDDLLSDLGVRVSWLVPGKQLESSAAKPGLTVAPKPVLMANWAGASCRCRRLLALMSAVGTHMKCS